MDQCYAMMNGNGYGIRLSSFLYVAEGSYLLGGVFLFQLQLQFLLIIAWPVVWCRIVSMHHGMVSIHVTLPYLLFFLFLFLFDVFLIAF